MALRRWSVRHFVAVVAAVTSLSLLAACGEDEKPELKRTPVSETPSASESPSASETPEPKQESAKAFIRRWMKASDKMQVTGDTKPYRRLATKFCASCERFADTVDEIHDAGGSIEFDGTRIVSLSRMGGTKNQPKFEMVTKTGRTSVVDRSGAQPRTLSGATTTYEIILMQIEDSWKVDSSLQRPRS